MQGHSATDYRIGEFVMWSALLIYFAAWIFGVSIMGSGSILPAAFLASVYVGFHIYEINKRGHCYLSADSTAAPAVLVTALVMSFVIFDSSGARIRFGGHVGLAFALGHIAALLYSFTLGGLLGWIFRKRIRAELTALTSTPSASPR